MSSDFQRKKLGFVMLAAVLFQPPAYSRRAARERFKAPFRMQVRPSSRAARSTWSTKARALQTTRRQIAAAFTLCLACLRVTIH